MRIRELFENALPNENSLGKPIARDKQSLSNFWRWFSGSKIVDSSGRPLVVYHGGTVDKVFDTTRRGSGGGRESGFFFTPDIRQARDYAGRDDNLVKHVYLSIKNPMFPNAQLDPSEAKDAKDNGHDGYWIIEDGLVDESEIVAFYSTQVKSAIGNNGKFDASNLNIYENHLYLKENPK